MLELLLALLVELDERLDSLDELNDDNELCVELELELERLDNDERLDAVLLDTLDKLERLDAVLDDNELNDELLSDELELTLELDAVDAVDAVLDERLDELERLEELNDDNEL